MDINSHGNTIAKKRAIRRILPLPGCSGPLSDLVFLTEINPEGTTKSHAQETGTSDSYLSCGAGGSVPGRYDWPGRMRELFRLKLFIGIYNNR